MCCSIPRDTGSTQSNRKYLNKLLQVVLVHITILSIQLLKNIAKIQELVHNILISQIILLKHIAKIQELVHDILISQII